MIFIGLVGVHLLARLYVSKDIAILKVIEPIKSQYHIKASIMKKLSTFILGLTLSLSTMANTAYEQGIHYAKLRTEDGYRQAFSYFHQAAKQGNNKAQLMLGVMYNEGMGTQQDYHKAVEWYIKSANQGNVIAQNNLGRMYENGYGVHCTGTIFPDTP